MSCRSSRFQRVMRDLGIQKINQKIGVYVHWPFCAQKCPYCDFNSHVRFGGWDEERFLKAYCRELDTVAAQIGQREVGSIFLGGGTPSLMQAQTVEALLTHIAKLWVVSQDAEVTLEANPNSVEAQRFRDYRKAGINRASVGVQSFIDEDLKRLGRLHSADEARKAIDIARQVFDRFSFDLIYARSGQRIEAWEKELQEALDRAGDHLSLYQLTIEPDTPFAELHKKGALKVPDQDQASLFYTLTGEMTAQRGFETYEVSNYARHGQECRHNMLYWRYGPYVGVGPGAHGRLSVLDQRLATVTERNPERWVELVETHGHGFTEQTPLSKTEQADEMLLMGLRTSEGVDLEEILQHYGVAPSRTEVEHLAMLGLLEVLGRDERRTKKENFFAQLSTEISGEKERFVSQRPRIRARGEGRLVLNELVRRLSMNQETDILCESL
ncbi:MAG: radical SAM family heme chaperone HemW [Hyphomicrobium sp.]